MSFLELIENLSKLFLSSDVHYKTFGLCDNGHKVFVMSLGTDGGDVDFSCADITPSLIKELESKYQEYLSNSSEYAFEIVEWVESIISHHGFSLHRSFWG